MMSRRLAAGPSLSLSKNHFASTIQEVEFVYVTVHNCMHGPAAKNPSRTQHLGIKKTADMLVSHASECINSESMSKTGSCTA